MDKAIFRIKSERAGIQYLNINIIIQKIKITSATNSFHAMQERDPDSRLGRPTAPEDYMSQGQVDRKFSNFILVAGVVITSKFSH